MDAVRGHSTRRAESAPPSLQEVKQTLRRLIEENAGIPAASIRDDSTLDGDLAMDSLSFVSTQVAVEETFGIWCEPEDIEAQNRFDAIALFIHARMTGAPRLGPQAKLPPTKERKRPGQRQTHVRSRRRAV
jgi:acyl carrier protein